MRVFALATLCVAQVAATCMTAGDCEKQMSTIVEDIRQRITDRLQGDIEDDLGVAPALVESTAKEFAAGFLNTDMTVSSGRYKTSLLEHFWYQLNLNPSVDWIYYGDEATNSFIGLRKAQQCEYLNNCTYAGKANPFPTVTQSTIVRLLTNTATGALEYYTTVTASGSDAINFMRSDSTFVLKTRSWYVDGKAPTSPTTVWTAPYAFSGDVLGVTVARKVVEGGVFKGVLAADYELKFLTEFIKKVQVQATSSIFIMSHDKFLLGTNTGVNTSSNYPNLLTTSAAGGIINAAANTVMTAHTAFASKTADWSAVSQNSQRGTFTYNGATYFYDAIGVLDPRWVVVITSTASDFYEVEPEASGCVEATSCRSQLLRANNAYRSRTILYYQHRTKQRLSSAVAAVVSLDNSYNMGNLNNAWCPTTCGMLDWGTDRNNLRKALSNTLDTYEELAWLYFGMDQGSTVDPKVVGYKKTGTNKELWTSCVGVSDCSGDGSYFYTEDANMALVDRTSTYSGNFFDQAWYKTGSLLAFDKVGWTAPYVFGDGDVGVTLYRKAFGGDFSSTGFHGVWGADFTLTFLKTFVAGFSVPGSTVIYIMDKDGFMIAANRDIAVVSGTTLLNAKNSADAKVKSSATHILAAYPHLQDSIDYQVLLENSDPAYFVDAVLLRDVSTEVSPSYNWIMVMVSVETDLYEIPNDEAASGIIISIATMSLALLSILL